MATFTTRLNATKPASSENVSITTLNNDFDLFDAAVGATVGASSARPASAFSGRLWYESDTGAFRVNTASSASTAASWAVVAGGSSSSLRNFPVKSYGAIGDGVTNDTAAFTAAAAAMVAAGSGVLDLGTGIYKVTSLPTLTPPASGGPLPYAVRGDGAELATIMHYGTAQASSLTVKNASFNPNSPSTGAPQWEGFTIDGANSSGGCCGLVWGDVSYPSFEDVQMVNFASGDGWFFNNPNGWCEGVNMRKCHSEYNGNQLHFDVGSGRQIGVITTTLTSAVSYTTIAISGGLSEAVAAGQKLVIATGVSAIGVTTQTVTTTSSAAQGATSISVSSFTAAATYTASTARLYFGGYGSFDYWTVDSLYMQANANQNGIVSEISRGIDQNMQRVGSRMRVTGNFHTGATNTGAFMVLKGDDTWNDTVWQVDVEADGSTVAHKSLSFTSGSAVVTGNGTFILYGLTTATFTGGIYQFGVTGQVCVAGISDTSTGLVFRQMRRPGFLDVASGVTPTRGGTSASPVAGQYPNTVANATAWQNTTGQDVLVTVPIAFTGTGTAAWNVDVWNGLPSNLPGGGGAAVTMAAGPSGTTIPLTFIHYNRMWARVDVTNATISAPYVRYHD